jgi:hypothetical protein
VELGLNVATLDSNKESGFATQGILVREQNGFRVEVGIDDQFAAGGVEAPKIPRNPSNQCKRFLCAGRPRNGTARWYFSLYLFVLFLGTTKH